MLQEHVKTTKTDKTFFFFAKEGWTWYRTKKLLIKVPFQSTTYRNKELCVDNNVWETIGDVCCPTCRNEKCVSLSTDRTTSFYGCKKCEACCHVWIFLLWTRKRQFCCLAVMVHIVLRERRVATTKKKNQLFFEEISPPITTKQIRTLIKKGKNFPLYSIIVATRHWLIQWTKTSLTFSF